MFADLTGFTALAERLDAEDVSHFQGALFTALREAVARFGGFVAKFLGDAVLAVFGAPVAHEDDPARALDAALEMLSRSEALSAKWASRLGQPVLLHIAVHTGPVVAGSFVHATYDITGDTVNTAARLLTASEAGYHPCFGYGLRLTCHRFAFLIGRKVSSFGAGLFRSLSTASKDGYTSPCRSAGYPPMAWPLPWWDEVTNWGSSWPPSIGCTGAVRNSSR